MAKITRDYQYLKNSGMRYYHLGQYQEAIEQFNLAISALGSLEALSEFHDIHKYLYRSVLLRDAKGDKGIDYLIRKQYYEEAVTQLQELADLLSDTWIWELLNECKKYVLRPFEYPNGYVGYENDYGEQIIPPMFIVAEPFEEGRAAVSDGRYFALINRGGSMYTEYEFDLVHCTVGGFTTVEKDHKYNLINPEGNLHFKKWYDFVNPYVGNGLRIVKKGKKYGCVLPDGKIKIPIIYNHMVNFNEGVAGVKKKGGKFGFIDIEGNEAIPFEYESISGSFQEGLAGVKADNGKWGFIDKENNMHITPKWDSVGDFAEGLAAVERGGRWGMIDSAKGEVVIPLEFDNIFEHVNGLGAVELKGKYHFINKTGVILGEADYHFKELFDPS